MAVTDEQVRMFTQYEHLVDRMMTLEPFSGLCGYDIGVVGPSVRSQLACLHPVSVGEAPLFHLSWAGGGHLAMDGEWDSSTDRLFRQVLGSVDWDSGPIRLDMGGAEFVDHRSLLILEEFAARNGSAVELVNVAGSMRRLLTFLEPDVSRLIVAN